MSEVSFKSAHIDDLNLILDMEEECFNRYDLFKPYQVRRFLKNPCQTFITDIILKAGEPVGWATYLTRKKSRLIRLYSLCIRKSHWGKGIAYSYLRQRVSQFSGYNAMILEVRLDNQPAIRLYEKLGFVIRKVFIDYYDDGADAYRMVLRY